MSTDPHAGYGQHGIREIVRRNPVPVVAVLAVAVTAALFFAHRSSRPTPGQGAYFSADDGETYFENAPRIPPFDTERGEAVRAFVYSCGDGDKFVGYLLRWTPEGKPAAEAALAGGRRVTLAGAEVKRPGDVTWTPVTQIAELPHDAGDPDDATTQAVIELPPSHHIMDVRCPDGRPATAHNPTPAGG